MVTDTIIENCLSLQHARVPTAAGFSIISNSCKNGKNSCFAVTDRMIETLIIETFLPGHDKIPGRQ